MPAPAPESVFCSYSSADEPFRVQLEDHLAVLKRAGVVQTWNFRQIEAGDDWKRRIDERLNASSIILLLVSSSFLGSDYCWDVEMKRALERHAASEAIVIPIILKDCDWHAAPFSKLQALPEGGKAVARWRPRDRAWSNVVAGIRKVVESRTERQQAEPLKSPVSVSSTQPGATEASATSDSISRPHAISFAHAPKAPGPWFHLVSAAFSSNTLDFAVKNEGAPAIVLDFRSVTRGCSVRNWHPNTLPSKEIFRAPTQLDDPNARECTFEMKVRDGVGAERLYRLSLDRHASPARLDFQEIG